MQKICIALKECKKLKIHEKYTGLTISQLSRLYAILIDLKKVAKENKVLNQVSENHIVVIKLRVK